MAAKRNIIVVGGGGAGAALARALSEKLDSTKYSLILISPREYYLHLPGTLRMLATHQGALEDTVLIPYDKLFHNNKGTFQRAAVTSISRNSDGRGGKIMTDSGEEIDYEVLVLAPGSHWEGGIDLPPLRADAVTTIQQWREKFKIANGVALVGGGAVGIELAGEIRDVYPDKKITLIHDKKHLLNETYPDKFRIDMENRMTKRKVLLVLDDAINDIPNSDAQAVTNKGVRIDADLVVPTRGGRPNTAFIASLGDGVLSPAGQVKVDPTLQLTGIPGVFAAGDVLDWKEVKQVAKYGGHAATIVPNVLSYLNGQPLKANYKSMFEAILITNGVNGGGTFMDVLWGLTFGDWFTKTLKSKDLFIAKTRQGLGYA